MGVTLDIATACRFTGRDHNGITTTPMASQWPPPRSDWFPGFTAHRDGWVRRYAGLTVFCGGRKASRKEVEDKYLARTREIDGAPRRAPISPGPSMTYRDLLSDFMAACEARCKTGKPSPMSRRTLHNYDVVLNQFGKFVGGGTPIGQIGPIQFSAFASKFAGWKASGFDSIVCRVSALFRWAAQMEYIDRFRPGPQFVRPAKAHIRDDRIALAKSFTIEEVAKLYRAANPTMRCWIGLGICCAFNNSDIANVTRDAIDLDAALIDFRRRKTGKIRRICPLPPQVVADLRAYVRPEPCDAAHDDHFFLSVNGHPYSGTRKRDGKPSDSISRLFRKLMDGVVPLVRGRNFSGLRTTAYNLMPDGLERKIIMGHAHGDIGLDSYLEAIGVEKLRAAVEHVWLPIQHLTSGCKAP